MVSKTTLTQHNDNMLPVFDSVLIRETLNKVDRCMHRLQELHFTVSGTSLRIKNSAQNTSPMGKFSANLGGEWRKMSLPAMLVGETVGEILQASQFAREIVSSVGKKLPTDGPKTPLSRYHKSDPETSQPINKRRKEKENKQQSDSPRFQPHRARWRINLEDSPPKKVRDYDEEKENINIKHSARNRPWGRKTVLFPNPLFSSTSCKAKSPVMSTTPHKFRIKSPYKYPIQSPNRVTKTPFKFRIKSPHVFVDKSQNRVTKTPSKFVDESRKRVTKAQHKFRTESQHKKVLIKSPSRAKTTTPHKFHIKTPTSPKRAKRLNYPKKCDASSISSRTRDGVSKSSPKSKKSDGVSKSSPKRSAASKPRRSWIETPATNKTAFAWSKILRT